MSRQLIRDSTIYGLGAFLSHSIGFLLIPLYTRYLSVAEYGSLALLNQILQLASFVFLLGISTAAMRFFFDDSADHRSREETYGTATLLLMALPLVLFTLMAPLVSLLVSRYLPSIPFVPYVLIILVTGLFMPMAKLAVGLLRVQRRAKVYVLFDMGFLATQAGAIILAVAWLGYGLLGQLSAQLFANAVFFAVGLGVLLRFCRPTLSGPIARRMLRFGVPLVPYFILTWLGEAAGRFGLEHFNSLENVGLFALASQFAGLLLLASTAFDNALMPHFLERASKPGAESELGLLVTRYVALFGLISLGIVAFSAPVIFVVAESSYYEAADYVAPLALANWLMTAQRPLVWCFTHSQQSGALSMVKGLSVGVLVAALLFFLGPLQLGIPGVAGAMILANAFFLVAGFAVSRLGFQLRIPWSRFWPITLVLLASGGLLAYLGGGRTLEPAVAALQVGILACSAVLIGRLAGIRRIRSLLPASG